ncbi:MAG: 16S rRNA (cytidine(1402)-2'-O)-methyltransferase [Oscillospiraceae bacterium]|nr:16S rRNA (cytidine(1402)-2'-O)-methyltransferase [Oscillospiraceae bacterium]
MSENFGQLFVVGTPIGNLGDITYRAVETLKSVDFICAEDTRVTVKLLNHYEIKKPLVSYHEHSARQVSESIVSRILAGENCAVVSDAGMPCISDPGEDLVRRCIESGIVVTVVPGPTAMASAVAVSGLSTSRFSFEGFLSVTKKQRFSHLQSVANDTRTLIFYEAPHKLVSTLEDMLEYFGDRKISLCRELTKVYEEVIRTTISGAIEYYSEKNPKGEYVLVVEGCSEEKAFEGLTLEDAVNEARRLIDSGMRAVDACKEAAKVTGYKKSEIYSKIQG